MTEIIKKKIHILGLKVRQNGYFYEKLEDFLIPYNIFSARCSKTLFSRFEKWFYKLKTNKKSCFGNLAYFASLSVCICLHNN